MKQMPSGSFSLCRDFNRPSITSCSDGTVSYIPPVALVFTPALLGLVTLWDRRERSAKMKSKRRRPASGELKESGMETEKCGRGQPSNNATGSEERMRVKLVTKWGKRPRRL